ncbi:TPA: hypothetical protein I7117_15290 [Vibrio vulnificus]|uniref:hypothetical protein n=1 Tax=Vibrio TaxID=662 RepID=UPI0018DBF764|nr:hypothetical protein [Vibrio navarrensis]MBH9740029.1 hypothetical protein [Vibrio navarrensis]HAS6100824.1 hypothetical protein [Vibrio vulnificus]
MQHGALHNLVARNNFASRLNSITSDIEASMQLNGGCDVVIRNNIIIAARIGGGRSNLESLIGLPLSEQTVINNETITRLENHLCLPKGWFEIDRPLFSDEDVNRYRAENFSNLVLFGEPELQRRLVHFVSEVISPDLSICTDFLFSFVDQDELSFYFRRLEDFCDLPAGSLDSPVKYTF